MKNIISFILLFSITQVKAQDPILISTDKTNILYSNLENDFNVSRIPKNSRVEVEGCNATIRKNGNGDYSIYPKTTGYVKILLRTKSSKKTISTIKVIDIPEPKFSLGNGMSYGNIKHNILMNSIGIIGRIEDFEYEYRINPLVTSYRIMFEDGTNISGDGGYFNSQIMAKMKNCQKGDRIMIYSICYKFNDGKIRTYNSALSFTIE
jgi:hypothetical protein